MQNYKILSKVNLKTSYNKKIPTVWAEIFL